MQKSVNFDEVVVMGVAIQVGIIKGLVEDVLLLDVIFLFLGIEIKGGIFTKFIEKNRTILTSYIEVFMIVQDY